MMRILIATLLLCSVADAQSISVSGGRKSLIVSGVGSKETPKHIVPEKQETIAVTSGGREPVLLERTENPKRFKFSAKSTETTKPTKRREWYLVSEAWCSHCPAAKRRFLSLGWPKENILTIAQCEAKFGFRPPHVPFEFGEPLTDKPVSRPSVQTQPARHIQWPGWGTIDLETYSRNCNCSMCVSIRAKQREYQQQMLHFQRSRTQVTPDQEGCPYDVVERMLDAMDLRSNDVLGDLGCGDGRILIAAARRGVRGIGVEIDPNRADVARQKVKEAGLEHLITVETGDALNFDTNRITVATAYLYPPLLEKLSEKLKRVRVAASPFHEVPGLQMAQIGDVWVTRN